MGQVTPEPLAEFLRTELGDSLRSVIHYSIDVDERGEPKLDHDLVYVREDVDAAYTDEELQDVVRDLGLESFGKEFQERLYNHGALDSIIRCFEGAIEMHFIVGEGEGVAVAMEPETFVAERTFVGRCMEVAGLTPESEE
mgnify:CR=1 FL=1